MKKTLYSTTALAAAGLLTLGAGDAFAQAKAPEKLKIAIGGFFTAYAGYADQSGSFEDALASGNDKTHYSGFDVKNDSEIKFSGSVKLDNGMTVKLQMEFEADTAQQNTGTGMDESWLALDTNGYGEVRIGTQKLTQLVLGVGAPTAGGLNPSNGDTSLWIVRPSAGQSNIAAFGHPSGADQNRINYYSPTVAGFRFGASYTPSTTESDAQPVTGGTAGTQVSNFDAALQYSTKISDVGVRASVAFNNNESAASSDSAAAFTGLDLKFGDITVGGSYRRQWSQGPDSGTNSNEIEGFNAGILYNPGPWKIALRTTQAFHDGARATTGRDKAIMYKIGANYTLGPGVELTGDLISMKWEDEADLATAENKGWAAIGGIAVTF